jgi:hypothetical protein
LTMVALIIWIDRRQQRRNPPVAQLLHSSDKEAPSVSGRG